MYTFSIKSGSVLAQNCLQQNVLFVEFGLNFSQSFPVSAGSNSLISRASLLFFSQGQKFLYLKRLLAPTPKAQIFSFYGSTQGLWTFLYGKISNRSKTLRALSVMAQKCCRGETRWWWCTARATGRTKTAGIKESINTDSQNRVFADKTD